jgi:hypothetical protein
MRGGKHKANGRNIRSNDFNFGLFAPFLKMINFSDKLLAKLGCEKIKRIDACTVREKGKKLEANRPG